MDQDLQKLKELYLGADVDDETKEDNMKVIREWEKAMTEKQEILQWKGHEVTKFIVGLLKKEYVKNALELGTNDRLSESDRNKIWSKQNGILFMFSYMLKDAKSELVQLETNIKNAISSQINS